jgi:hypothetical protein
MKIHLHGKDVCGPRKSMCGRSKKVCGRSKSECGRSKAPTRASSVRFPIASSTTEKKSNFSLAYHRRRVASTFYSSSQLLYDPFMDLLQFCAVAFSEYSTFPRLKKFTLLGAYKE